MSYTVKFFGCRYTQNSWVLACLSNFFLSVRRTKKNSIETLGQLLCYIGILWVFLDGFLVETNDYKPSSVHYGLY